MKEKEINYKEKFHDLLDQVKWIKQNMDSVLLDQTDAYFASEKLKELVQKFSE